ncbi:hypothetical protein V475_23165 [Sphingobium baderi LL03]|nr:hypothetical protein V475_23165 [Sphingobium baderi LL03]
MDRLLPADLVFLVDLLHRLLLLSLESLGVPALLEIQLLQLHLELLVPLLHLEDQLDQLFLVTLVLLSHQFPLLSPVHQFRPLDLLAPQVDRAGQMDQSLH